MSVQTVYFNSEGDQLEADLYLPDDLPEGTRPPVVVLAGGWCYVKELVQPIYAKAFAAAGIAALVFDYRGLGGSEGVPRQHLDPERQQEDYRNAISYLGTRADVDASRLGIWGISYSGGHVLILGATDPRVKCVVSIVPVVDGLTTLKQAHGTLGYRRLVQTIAEAREKLWSTGEHSFIPHASTNPERDIVTWPFPASQPLFAMLKETQGPRYENRATVASTEMLLRYSVYPHVERIIDTPTMMVVAEGDDHTMWDLEIEAFHQIRTPKKQLEVVPAKGHHGLYRDKDKIGEVAGECAKWFSRWL
ncbi:alpha/beta hydrolase [Amycolatopsis pithecellobii]|uniref:Alpha/beta fold hydrolase n=1 Tax=Amycolatopsis pithecellobii TaxID=664692 RepID=A0A6N7Z5R3_9PSEU|nr:alpha/beta fold hydrolase [Amycolatopsis pithecellobii]MTD57049.1 alpha/beta fold hydrolase [Amycolatopsis pithecellobii]